MFPQELIETVLLHSPIEKILELGVSFDEDFWEKKFKQDFPFESKWGLEGAWKEIYMNYYKGNIKTLDFVMQNIVLDSAQPKGYKTQSIVLKNKILLSKDNSEKWYHEHIREYERKQICLVILTKNKEIAVSMERDDEKTLVIVNIEIPFEEYDTLEILPIKLFYKTTIVENLGSLFAVCGSFFTGNEGKYKLSYMEVGKLKLNFNSEKLLPITMYQEAMTKLDKFIQ